MTARHGLFVAQGSSGKTSPQEARLALAGLLTGAGILAGPSQNVAGSTSGPNMKYVIPAAEFATARGNVTSDGLMLWANDGSLTVDSGAPAPTSGTRWDLVWVRHANANDGFGDADSDPHVGVTVGASGSTPTKPYGSVPAGALVLAESQVGTSIANASLATIAQVVAKTVATGGIQPATGSSQYPANPYVGQYVDDATLGLLRWDGANWQPYGRGGDTGWVTITLGASYKAVNAASTPQVRLSGRHLDFEGILCRQDGNNLATAAVVAIWGASAFPNSMNPGMQINRMLSAQAAHSAVRGYLGTDGSLSVATNDNAASYIDISALSGIIPAGL